MHGGVGAYVMGQLNKLQGCVLEVGSLNVNGTTKEIVPHSIGTDMRAGDNVDIVCPAEKLMERFGREKFDAVLSCDAFEHMENWRACLRGMWGVIRPDGWLVITMASPAKGRHNHPNDYWRANWEHIIRIFPNADNMSTFGPSMGWTVQKTGELPNLEEIELIKVP